MKSFEEYDVSEETGFIINQQKEISLSSYYDPWVILKGRLDLLFTRRTLSKYVEEMPLLSLEYLKNDMQRRYCRCILAMATTVFVWHQREVVVPKILPKSLAVPLMKLSSYFGLMPILSHCDLVLMNTMTDHQTGQDHQRYIRIKEELISNPNWNVFQRETARVEISFAPVISAIGRLHRSIKSDDAEGVTSGLRKIAEAVNAMKTSLRNFDEMDPDFFHTEMRPFLVGWSGASFPHPGGLLYENEQGTFTQIECVGASAAQSPTLMALDYLFKIEHSINNQHFFDEMKAYMLRGHREFLEDLQKYVSLDTFVESHRSNESLVQWHNKCIDTISSYRTSHMLLVSKFIIYPAKKLARYVSDEEFLQQRGTGGQDLINFLKEVRDDVKKKTH